MPRSARSTSPGDGQASAGDHRSPYQTPSVSTSLLAGRRSARQAAELAVTVGDDAGCDAMHGPQRRQSGLFHLNRRSTGGPRLGAKPTGLVGAR